MLLKATLNNSGSFAEFRLLWMSILVRNRRVKVPKSAGVLRLRTSGGPIVLAFCESLRCVCGPILELSNLQGASVGGQLVPRERL